MEWNLNKHKCPAEKPNKDKKSGTVKQPRQNLKVLLVVLFYLNAF